MMYSSNEDFSAFFDSLQVLPWTPNDLARQRFEIFYRELRDWNRRINLISRKEAEILDRHFLNSLSIAFFSPFTFSDNVADIGSGGGFPAIPLKIIFPETKFTLFETVRKKVDFLRAVAKLLHLEDMDVIHQNVEFIDAKYRGRFDYVTARAVASTNQLVRMCLPLLKPDGRMLFLKGKSFEEEVSRLDDGCRILHVFQLSSCPLFKTSQDGHLLVLQMSA